MSAQSPSSSVRNPKTHHRTKPTNIDAASSDATNDDPSVSAYRPSLLRSPPHDNPAHPEALASPITVLTPGLPNPSENVETRPNVSEATKGDTMEGDVGGDAAGERLGDDVRRLREAVLRSQQRARLSSRAATGPPSPASVGARRVSPIKEETPSSVLSPTLDASFASPLTTGGQTASTESTESAGTVRASVPATPSQQPLRTPSYPFPYVPGTPRSWSQSFHQPFTNLSPTVSSMNIREHPNFRDKSMSDPGTPADSVGTFMPGNQSQKGSHDEQYPTPSLYDMVLLLNSEPGLEAWWAAVVKMMHEWYGAERVSLAVPADINELENVPWGQKATFNVAGPVEQRSAKTRSTQSSGSSHRSGPLRNVYDEEPRTPLRSASNRPQLSSRHSYAGYEREGRDAPTPLDKPAAPPARPKAPLRTASHAPQSTTHTEAHQGTTQPARSLPMPHPLKRQVTQAFSDPDFSSHGEADPPHETIFPSLQALDAEKDALIDSSGITRVIDRGRVVTLTRDYTGDTSTSRRQSSWSAAPAALDTSSESEPDTQKPRAKLPRTRRDDPRFRTEKAGKLSADYFSAKKSSTQYEEYEQFPSSPWAQSPAPSPAIQADPSDNPFFAASPNVDEDSFNPTETTQDYAHYGQVEAIGVDKASTVTHVPLIHPLLSQLMYSSASESASSRPGAFHQSFQEEYAGTPYSAATAPNEPKKAPIAILSFLSSTVPFPQNLTQSLRLLGPHLATTFSNAQHYSNAYKQATNARSRRWVPNQRVGFAPLPSDADSLEDLLHLDIEDIAESGGGSITSPSDYSGHSQRSPGNSLAGTPGWDPSAIGFSSKPPLTGTPGGSEVIDSYFDAKRRTSGARATGSVKTTQRVSGSYGGRTSPGIEMIGSTSRKMSSAAQEEEGETPTPKNEPKPPKTEKTVSLRSHKDQASISDQDKESARRNGNKTVPAFEHTEHKSHSQLHTFGADFGSSFQLLPTTATPLRAPAPMGGHARTRSSNEQDMLPPSERLLRIIIDSLPVQIFMAAPLSGALTWANSKYLVYRGQDSKQILQDPWKAIHPSEREQHLEMWKRSLSTGQQYSQKLRIQRFDGQYRWFYVRAAPLKDKRQNIVHWIGTNMDFHDQHIAETNAAKQSETAASEAKYRAVANSSPQIVFAVTRSRGVTFCNSQWTKYSGQTEEQARGLGFMDFVHPEDLGKCRLPTFNEDGTAVDVPTTLPPEPKRTVSISQTSSDDSEDTGTTVMSPGSSGIPATQQLPQSKLSRLASTGILKVSRDSDGRPSYSTEVRLRAKDGNYRWHLVRVLSSQTVIHDEDDEETWYGTCTDINDHKLLEQTLKETMDAKSRFLSNMSHEIRTPLNGITGMVNFLIDSNLTAEQMEHVNIIRNSTEGLRDLINDILDLSKVEAGMITLSMDWMHIRSLIEEVNDLTSAMAIDKGLELNYIVDSEVPPMVKGDRFRIRQVLLNVIGNAIKFTQKGEVFVRCRPTVNRELLVKKNDSLILFEVIDTGSGFTEKEAEFLFKRFSQIDGSSTRQHGGTGLGLAISMQLVELHGGKMKASSVPGKGSTFTFSI
ncbi:hypothetical protein LTS18_002738, partial [Coniosporium uncinatum]